MERLALIYARVSSQEQARGWSPATQLEACRAYAHEHAMTIAGEYTDVETGAITERPGFQAMMDAIRAGKAIIVIVYQTDRLHRDLAHAMLTRRELHKLGVELHTVRRGRSGVTPEEQFADNIDDLLAELERARIMERTNRGKRKKMQEGLVLGAGPAPYGYHYIGQQRDRRLEIDEEIAPIVRDIFRWYVYGDGQSGPLSVGAIADRLTERRAPTPADRAGRDRWHKARTPGEWVRNYVYPILNQTAYSGTYALYRRRRTGKTTYQARPEAEQFHVEVPAIIDRETWETAQQRLAAGKAQSRGHQIHEYLIGRHVRCACGYKAHGRGSSKDGPKTKTRLWYICNGRVRRATVNPCAITLPWFRADVVDTKVWTWLADLLRDEAQLEERIRLRQKYQRAAQDATKTDRSQLQARRAKVERASQRILDLYESEEIDRQEWRRRKTANDAEIAEIDRQLAALDAPTPKDPLPPLSDRMADAIRALSADVRPRLDSLPFEGKRRLIEALDVQVTLDTKRGKKIARVECILGTEVLQIP